LTEYHIAVRRNEYISQPSINAQIENQKLSLQLEELKLKMKNFIFGYKVAFKEMSLKMNEKTRKVKTYR